MNSLCVLAIVVLLHGLLCIPVNAGWSEAEAKWTKFASEHMDRMRTHEAGLPRARQPGYKFDMKWSRLNHDLLKQYLPEFKFFRDTRFSFALDEKGHIICLGSTWPLNRPFDSAPDFETKPISEFLKDRKIKVTKEEIAIQLTELCDVLIGGTPPQKDWQAVTSRDGNTWKITRRYVGPPASIMMPPVWEVKIDSTSSLLSIGTEAWEKEQQKYFGDLENLIKVKQSK